MKHIKKIFSIILVFIFIFILSSCNKNLDNPVKIAEKLTILTVNDFHGALEEEGGKYGISSLVTAFNTIKSSSEATVILSAGDMFQGTAISNYDHGKTTIDIMNYMQFDAMTLGNHEFDWGLSVMQAYQDGNASNGEANFPFLGCNIYEKESNSLPEGVKPYQIVERGGLKIGIVGYMGYGNEVDISVEHVKDYEFKAPVNIIAENVKKLRTEEKVDIVIVMGHEGNDSNQQLAKLDGDSRIDAIINSHTHARYSGTIKGSNNVDVPYVQAGSAGKYFGLVELEIDSNSKTVKGGSAVTKTNDYSQDEYALSIVNKLLAETAPVFQRVIGTATMDVDRYGAADWAATALKDYANADIGVINSGGIRAQAFPILKGSAITVAKIHEIMPFDNVLKTVELKGSDVKTLVSTFVFSNNVVRDNATGDVYINGEKVQDDKYYLVASIDYIFDNHQYPFFKGQNPVNTGVLFRDILIDRVEKDQSIILVNR